MIYPEPEYLVGISNYDSFHDEHYVVKDVFTKEELLKLLKEQAEHSYGCTGYHIDETEIDSFIKDEVITGSICSIEKVKIDFLSDEEMQDLQNIYNKEVVKTINNKIKFDKKKKSEEQKEFEKAKEIYLKYKDKYENNLYKTKE